MLKYTQDDSSEQLEAAALRSVSASSAKRTGTAPSPGDDRLGRLQEQQGRKRHAPGSRSSPSRAGPSGRCFHKTTGCFATHCAIPCADASPIASRHSPCRQPRSLESPSSFCGQAKRIIRLVRQLSSAIRRGFQAAARRPGRPLSLRPASIRLWCARSGNQQLPATAGAPDPARLPRGRCVLPHYPARRRRIAIGLLIR